MNLQRHRQAQLHSKISHTTPIIARSRGCTTVPFARRQPIDIDVDFELEPEPTPVGLATRPSYQRPPPPPPPPSPPIPSPSSSAAGSSQRFSGRDLAVAFLGAGVGVLWMFFFYDSPNMEAYRSYDSYMEAVKRNALSRIYQGNEVTPEFLMGLDNLLEDSYQYQSQFQSRSPWR